VAVPHPKRASRRILLHRCDRLGEHPGTVKHRRLASFKPHCSLSVVLSQGSRTALQSTLRHLVIQLVSSRRAMISVRWPSTVSGAIGSQPHQLIVTSPVTKCADGTSPLSLFSSSSSARQHILQRLPPHPLGPTCTRAVVTQPSTRCIQSRAPRIRSRSRSRS